jgi:hypothetical protein
MAQYVEVKGQVVEFPDGMAPADIEAAIKRNMMTIPPDKPKASRTDRVLTGMADPIHGGAQLLTNILPESVVQAGNRANNWLADKTGLVARLPEGGVDQQVREREAAIGQEGIDGYRMLGNFLSPANAGIARALPLGATLAGRVASGAAGGAMSAAAAPVTQGDFATEKVKQVATGAAFGGAMPVAISGLSRLVSPQASTNSQLALLKSEGVRPTVGQSLGGWANRVEEKAQSVPIMGDAIAAARQRASGDLNRAAANRALFPLGKSLPEGVKGNDAVLFVRQAMNDAYNDVAPRLSVTQDQTFRQTVGSLKNGVKQAAINPNTKKAFDRFVKDEMDPLFQGQNSMTGETFKRLQSKITEKIQQTSASTDADQRVLSGAYKELGEQLNQLSIRTNPKVAKELKAVNAGYANFKRLQKAASSVAAEDGAFTPAMLHSAVRAADRSKDKARFAEGGALMQDLSAAGKTMLNNKVPNSGTADRLMLGGAGLSAGLVSPMIPAGLLGGAAMYSQPMQALLSGAITNRPQSAQAIAEAMRRTSPLLAPAAGQVGVGLLQ